MSSRVPPAGTKKPGSSIIHDVFQGGVRVETLSRKTHMTKREEEDVDATAVSAEEQGWTRTENDLNFMYLTLDIPPTPLFKDTQGGNIIPQIPLFDVLTKSARPRLFFKPRRRRVAADPRRRRRRVFVAAAAARA